MRIVIDGVRAVTVELVGVIAVVWLLFGCASWGVHSATGTIATWPHKMGGVVDGFQLTQSAQVQSQADSERADYVAQRLSYYSRLLSVASKNFLRDIFAKPIASGLASQDSPGETRGWAEPPRG